MTDEKKTCINNCLKLELLNNNEIDSKDLLRLAINISKMGIWQWDLRTGKVDLSEEILDICGFSRHNFNPSISFIRDTMIHDDSRDEFSMAISDALNNGILNNGSYKVNNPLKGFCWVKVFGQVICDTENKPIKIIGALIDVTEEFMLKNILQVELDYLHSLIEMIPNPIFYKDRKGIYKFFNKAFMNYLGKSYEEIYDKTVFEVAPKDLANIYHKADLDLMENRDFQEYESEVIYADGTRHNVVFNKAAHIDQFGNCIGLIGIMLDVTKQRKKDEEVELLYRVKDKMISLNQELMNVDSFDTLLSKIVIGLKSIYNNIDQTIILKVVDDNKVEAIYKEGFEPSFEWPEYFNMDNFFFWHIIGTGFKKAHVIKDFNHQLSSFGLTVEGLTDIKDGIVIPVHHDEKLEYIIACGSKITDSFNESEENIAQYVSQELSVLFRQFELYQKVLYMSKFDQLTGLYNRHSYEKDAETFYHQSKNKNTPFHILVFDLNNLKDINDTYGHKEGDKYIVAFSNLLKKYHGDEKLIARLGGDEFACICYNHNIETMINRIEDMKSEFNQTVIKMEEKEFIYDFSYGYATFPNDGNSLDELFTFADKKMYKNKFLNREAMY